MPTESLRQRLLKEQSAQYVDESELPFSVSLSSAVVDDHVLVDELPGDVEQSARLDGAMRDAHDKRNNPQG
jgi:hypothetical protein